MNSTLLSLRMLVFLLAIPVAASAQVPPDYELNRQGVELRGAGRDRDALEVFERALEMTHSPRALAQVALAEQALGRWLDAEEHLAAALTFVADSWIAHNHTVLEQAYTTIAQHIGRLELELQNAVPGVTIRIDGREMGTLPLQSPLRLLAGTVIVEVEAEGYYTITRRVTIPAGSTSHEEIALEQRSVQAEAAPIAHETRAPRFPDPARSVASAVPSHASRVTPPSHMLQTYAWVTAGTSTALLLGGVSLLISGNDSINNYNDDRQCLPASGATREATCSDFRSDGQLMQTLGITGLVLGSVGVVSSALLFLWSPKSPSSRVSWLWGDLRPGFLGIECGGVI